MNTLRVYFGLGSSEGHLVFRSKDDSQYRMQCSGYPVLERYVVSVPFSDPGVLCPRCMDIIKVTTPSGGKCTQQEGGEE